VRHVVRDDGEGVDERGARVGPERRLVAERGDVGGDDRGNRERR